LFSQRSKGCCLKTKMKVVSLLVEQPGKFLMLLEAVVVVGREVTEVTEVPDGPTAGPRNPSRSGFFQSDRLHREAVLGHVKEVSVRTRLHGQDALFPLRKTPPLRGHDL